MTSEELKIYCWHIERLTARGYTVDAKGMEKVIREHVKSNISSKLKVP